MLPIFAAIVLRSIPVEFEKELHAHTKLGPQSNTPLDGKMGGLPIVMAYVDDANGLLHLEDVEFFLEKFNEYGRKFGAIMNSKKPRS